MENKKILYVDFKDVDNNELCTVKYNGNKKTISKSVFMKSIIENKLKRAINIKSETQFIYDRFRYGGFITGEDVFKYTISCADGGTIIIRNVCESDLYYEELEALAAHKRKIVLKKDEIYPDFPKASDFSYQDPNKQKRR